MKTVLCLLLMAVFLMLASEPEAAGPVTFRICGGSDTVIFKRGPNDSIQVLCPGKTTPDLNIVGCVQPKVQRVGGDYTLTCVSWRPADIVPRP